MLILGPIKMRIFIDPSSIGLQFLRQSALLCRNSPQRYRQILALAGGAGSGLGTGGMATKLKAAQMVMENGSQMVIANGDRPEILYDIVEGKEAGTRFKGGNVQ